MSTSTASWITSAVGNTTKYEDFVGDSATLDVIIKPNRFWLFVSNWFLRLSCILVLIICPWANYKLIEFFQKRRFYSESSAKWYIIFKAIFDIIYMLISVPVIFSLTFNIDIIHRNIFTCKLLTYLHYLSDDLVSMMLTLLCINRMLRITCGYRLRPQVSLVVCITITTILVFVNIHHLLRLQHKGGFCHKTYFSIWNYDFDIYYSFLYTTIAWSIILLASINLLVSLYCDRARRLRLTRKKQEQNSSKVLITGKSFQWDSDRLMLIDETEQVNESITVVIEPSSTNSQILEIEHQDNVDLQITGSVLILSGIFLACNLPSYIIFVMRFVFHSIFSTIGYIFIYISLFPLLLAHTISYFVFNHFAARFYPAGTS